MKEEFNREKSMLEVIEAIILGKAPDKSKIEVLKDLFGYSKLEEDNSI